MRRGMTVPAGPGLTRDTSVKHYYALVRPDTEQIMSVVTSAYAPADNRWVAEAVENYARPFQPRPPTFAELEKLRISAIDGGEIVDELGDVVLKFGKHSKHVAIDGY